jgi:hypothetical protein
MFITIILLINQKFILVCIFVEPLIVIVMQLKPCLNENNSKILVKFQSYQAKNKMILVKFLKKFHSIYFIATVKQ